MTEQTNTPAKPRRTRKPKQAAPAPAAAATPPPADVRTDPPKRMTKKDRLILMLRQEGGVTLPELVTATGWLPHTARAALTGLRKAGHVIDKGKRDDVTCYSIKAAG